MELDKIKLNLEAEERSSLLNKIELKRRLSRDQAETQMEVECHESGGVICSDVGEALCEWTVMVDSDVHVWRA